MAGLIFPNSSYFAALDATGNHANLLQLFEWRHRCRTYRSKDVADFKRAIGSMKRCMGGIVFANGLSAADQENARSFLNKGRIPAVLIQGSDAAPSGALDNLVKGLVPRGLEKLVTFCAGLAFPRFFPELGALQPLPPSDGYNREITYCTVDGGLLGFCSLKLNLKAAADVWPNRSVSRLIGDAAEMANQFLGLITQNLGQLNIHPKIGLPTVFDLTTNPEVETMVYFPSVQVRDEKAILELRLGYSHLDGEPLFDFSGVEPIGPTDEIEML